jgi:hypothetical protein
MNLVVSNRLEPTVTIFYIESEAKTGYAAYTERSRDISSYRI